MNLDPDDSTLDNPRSPGPVLSSRARGWVGLDLDVFSAGRVTNPASLPAHLVWVQAAGSATWRRPGHVERALRAGDVCVASAFGPRDWLGTTDGTTLLLSVEPAFLDRMLARVGGWPRAHVELQETIARSDPRLATIATLLWQELRESSVGTQVYAQAAITQFVLQLIRRYAGAPRSGATAVRMSPHRLQRVKAYVDENLAEDLCVEALARVAGMSPFHFAHAFSSSTGLPPHRYVVQRRLERAKSLLSDTDLSLTQIAHTIGFSQPSHFCVAFQKATQLAPSAFRKSC